LGVPTYRESSSTPWGATTDFGKVGQLGEGLCISEGNIDD
jgi:hypothetical protein